MDNTTTARDNALDDIYRRIPEVHCLGLCYEACGPVGISEAEAARMQDAGFEPPDFVKMLHGGCLTCPLLTAEKRCAAYDVRPLVCRLFGAVRELPCPYGCRPMEYVSDHQARTMYRKIARVAA